MFGRKIGFSEEKPRPIRVFISYSRKDSVKADALVEMLERHGFEVRIDRRDLPYGEAWQKELGEFIHFCDVAVWLLSESSVKSNMVLWELGEIQRNSKRLVPVAIEAIEVADLPPSIGEVHLLPSTGIFDESLHSEALTEAIRTDGDWLRAGTSLGDQARAWGERGFQSDDLLRGSALASAELWRDQAASRRLYAAPEISDYIIASGSYSKARTRQVIAVLSASIVLLASLALFAFIQRGTANKQTIIAEEQRLLAEERESDALYSLGRIFADRAWSQVEEGDFSAAVRYAIAGWRIAPQSAPENRAPLAHIFQVFGDSQVYSLHQKRVEQIFALPKEKGFISWGRDDRLVHWSNQGEPKSKLLFGSEPTGTEARTNTAVSRSFTFDLGPELSFFGAQDQSGKFRIAKFPNRTRTQMAIRDGKLPAPGEIEIIDPVANQSISSVSTDEGFVVDVRFDPTAERIFARLHNGEFLIWDIKTETLLGKTNGVLDTPKQQTIVPAPPPSSIASMVLGDVEPRETVRLDARDPRLPYIPAAQHLEFSKDGSWTFSHYKRLDPTIWKIEDGQYVSVRIANRVIDGGFSQDGVLSIVSESELISLNPDQPELMRRFDFADHPWGQDLDSFKSLHQSAFSSSIAIRSPNKIHFFDSKSFEPDFRLSFNAGDKIIDFQFLDASRALILLEGGKLIVYDLRARRQLADSVVPGGESILAASLEHRRIVVGSEQGHAYVLDSIDANIVRQIPKLSSKIDGAQIDNHTKYLYTFEREGAVRSWANWDGENSVARFWSDPQTVNAFVSTDGVYALSWDPERLSVQELAAESTRLSFQDEMQGIIRAQMHSDNEILIMKDGSSDDTLIEVLFMSLDTGEITTELSLLSNITDIIPITDEIKAFQHDTGELSILDVPRKRVVRVSEFGGDATGGLFSENGTLTISTASGDLFIVSGDEQEINRISLFDDKPIKILASDSSARKLLIESEGLSIYDTQNLENPVSIELDEPTLGSYHIFDSAGESIVIGGEFGDHHKVIFVNTENGEVFAKYSGMLSIGYKGGDENLVVSDWIEKIIVLLDPEDFNEVGRFNTLDAVVAHEFSSDRRTVLLSAGNGSIFLYDVESGKLIRRFEATLEAGGQSGGISFSGFSPNQKLVYRQTHTSDNNLIVTVWDKKTGRPLVEYTSHSKSILGVAAMSADSQRMMIVSDTEGLRQSWDVSSLSKDIEALADEVCNRLLFDRDEVFSEDELNTDPVLREFWIVPFGSDNSVCDGNADKAE